MKEKEIVHLDNLVEACGFFVGGERAETNNGYGCSHPDQEERDSGNDKGQCFGFSCPLAWRLCPDQEEEDAKIMQSQGYEPDNSDGGWLCLQLDIHDTDGLAQGGRIWWRVPGHPNMESCNAGSPWEPRSEVRFVNDRSRCAEGETLGVALKTLLTTKRTTAQEAPWTVEL